MLTQQVALVSDVARIGPSELARVSAAIQKQVTRDLASVWEVKATIDPFPKLEEMPLGYWPIIVTERELGDAAGVHLDNDGQPYALVSYSDSWSLTASHECLEMLVDPYGNRVIAGPSPKEGQGRVEFLVEICDPCESASCAYTVNDVLVSDFYTPHYFEPTSGTNVRYSFNGNLKAPRTILEEGYLSWHDLVTDEWFQRTSFDHHQVDRSLGKLTRGEKSIREIINGLTPAHLAQTRLDRGHPLMKRTLALQERSNAASASKARRLREHVMALSRGRA